MSEPKIIHCSCGNNCDPWITSPDTHALPAILHSFSKQLRASSPRLWCLLKVRHQEYWETGVDVTHHTPEEHLRNHFIQHSQYLKQEQTKPVKYKQRNQEDPAYYKIKQINCYSPFPCSTLTSTRSILVCVNKARDEVWGNSDDKGVGDDRQDADTLQDAIPDP